jgi:septal ring factor EnvC (AmiA/AmiB activator)
VIKDKLQVGLSGELAKEWSRVHPKPDSVNGQMTLLREIGHAIEDHNKLEASQRGRKDCAEHHREDRQPNRQSNHCSKRNRKANGKPFGQKDQELSKTVSRFERTLQGVSREVRAKWKQEGVCLKCGKSGHGWADCRPNGQTGEKRKESSSSGETGSSVSKKPKTAAAAPAAPEPSTEVGRIMEIPDDEIDINIWGDD